MGLKKISSDKEDWQKSCTSPSHNPPGHMVYKNGTYEWECPQCGATTVFTVNNPTC